MNKLGLTLTAIAAALAINTATAGTMGPVEQLSWSGFYLGGNAGYGWSHRSSHLQIPRDISSELFFTPAIRAGAISKDIGYFQDGFIGGGQLGYNLQKDEYLIGIETDFDGASLDGNKTVRRLNAGTGFVPWVGATHAKLDWLGTVRARLGFTPIPQALLYVTGGYAYGHVKHRYSNVFALTNDIFTSSQSSTKSGYSIGGGAEWMFRSHWSAKVEYLYYDLGRSTEITTAGGANAFRVARGLFRPLANAFKDSGNVARIGVNYYFS